MRSAAAAASSASPSRTRTWVRAPSASSKLVCRAAHGSRPAPAAPCSRDPRSRPRGSLRSAVAAEELGPIGRPRRLPPAEVEEGDPAAELGVPRVAHEERPGLRLERRDDPGGAGPARGAQRPLGVGGHRQAPWSAPTGSRSSAPRPSAGRRAGRTGRGRARCRRGGARTGCTRRRDGRRTSTPRSGSAGPSDPRARRSRRPGRRSPRSPDRRRGRWTTA